MITAVIMLFVAPGAPPATDIPAKIAAFFRSDDGGERAKIAAEIAADPDYDRTKVGAWLHAAPLFEPAKPGLDRFSVKLSDGSRRAVVVRVPAGYDPQRPWPMLYALHGTGGNAEGIIGFYEKLLGKRIDEFILAAPDGYREMILYDPTWPPLNEHAAVRATVRRRFHIDSDRVYVSGYSKGGHTTWMEMILHTDELAGGVALAGTLVMPEPEQLWETLLPNLANSRLLCIWGENDSAGAAGQTSAAGGIAGLNHQIAQVVEQAKLPVTMVEMPGVGHGGVRPTDEQLWQILERRRICAPRDVRHVFRHESQSRAYWLAGGRWFGVQWADKMPKITFRAGEHPTRREDVSAAFGRALRGALGELDGHIEGQLIRVRRKRVRDVVVWIEDGMVDWQQPVTIRVGGRKVFDGPIEPNLYVCLSLAAQTYDLDRLFWAGVVIRSGSRGHVVDEKTDWGTVPRGR